MQTNPPSPTPFRRSTALLLAAILALQAGCVHHRSRAPAAPLQPVAPVAPVTEFQRSLGHVAVVSVAAVPETLTTDLRPYKDSSAHLSSSREPSGGGSNRNWGSGFGNCGDARVCAAVILTMLVIYGVIVLSQAAIHKVKEARTGDTPPNNPPAAPEEPVFVAPPEPEGPQAETALGASVIQDALRDEVVAAAKAGGVTLTTLPPQLLEVKRSSRDYTDLAARGIDTVLEVELTQVLTLRDDKASDPTLPLEMTAHVRLVKTRDNSLIHYADYTYYGKRHARSEWMAKHAERLRTALAKGYETLGRDISDSIFLLYPYAERKPQGDTKTCGLAPLEPADGQASSLSPTLSWQTFPREADKAAAPQDMAHVKNVKYDLIVGTGDNRQTPEIIYRRENIAMPSHKIALTLDPNTRYFWSVRARFTLDGRQRVTEWATRCPFEPQLIVGGPLYRFYTPRA